MPAAKQNPRWSGGVTRHSNALDLEAGAFKHRDPRAIALALRRSAETSGQRRASPHRSVMSMLTFYINRADKDLPAPQKRVLKRSERPRAHACETAKIQGSTFARRSLLQHRNSPPGISI